MVACPFLVGWMLGNIKSTRYAASFQDLIHQIQL